MSAPYKELRWIRLCKPTFSASLLCTSESLCFQGVREGALGDAISFQHYPFPSHSEEPVIKESVNKAVKHIEK